MTEAGVAAPRAESPIAVSVATMCRRRLDALEAWGTPRFPAVYRSYRTALEEAARAKQIQDTSEKIAVQFASLRTTLSTAPVAVFIIADDVMFTVGYAQVTRPEAQGVGSVAISTSILGDGIGEVFGALSSTTLKDYFKNNIAINAGFPVNGENRLSAGLGLGLGEVRIGTFPLWPALTIEQVDTADERSPRDIDRLEQARNWSAPGLAIGFLLTGRDELASEEPKCGLVVAGSVGLTFPYYYPDEPFSALVAVFTNNRGKYERAGKVGYSISLHIPLFPVAKTGDCERKRD